MRFRRFATTTAVTAALLLLPGTAFAFDCINASRPAPTGETSGPVFSGNWVWLPSIGVPVEAWGFGPPENFQNGKAHFLLENSAACGNENRQTDRGIQAGECL